MKEVTLRIDARGTMSFIYDDDLVPLLDAADDLSVYRVSHVEPNAHGEWEAEMVGGPVLGPFKLRADALVAERDWLARNRGL